MSERSLRKESDRPPSPIDARLAAYLAAAGALGSSLASHAEAAVVAQTAPQAFGVNQWISIDFNSDGQTDFQIDHDRVNLSNSTLDYLQIDKNDINGELNPLAFDPGPDMNFQATPFTDGATPRNDANDAAYVINGPQGSYPAALTAGTEIGPFSTFDFQEGGNFQSSGKYIRANRLIDEDATKIDQELGGQPASGVYLPTDGPNFVGLVGQVRYLGVKADFNNANTKNYGWIGIRIDNEADATGTVTGWAYETTPDVEIDAGDIGPASSADYNDDGQVDGADFLVWQRTLAQTVAASTGADGSGNGVIDRLDLAVWTSHFGQTAVVAAGQPASTAVPEPSSVIAAVIGAAVLLAHGLLGRRRRLQFCMAKAR
jgi:hypothetical protein